MTPPHDPGAAARGEPMPPGVMAAAEGAPHAPSAHRTFDQYASRRPDWRFLVASPWHLVALGFGSGLSPVAAGTVGTVFAWATFRLLDPWLGDAGWLAVIGTTLLLGAAAAQRTGEHLGKADSGHIVVDEVVAFWIVLWLLPATASGWLTFAAFILFRVFDITKPPPIGRLDARLKNGFGVMLDDLVAAFYTLLVVALCWRLLRG